MLTRRSLFGILAGAVAAPVVVRAGLLTPVKAIPEGVWLPDLYRGASTYVVTHTYPANAFHFTVGDIISMSGFPNLGVAPAKIHTAGYTAERIAA